MSGAYKCINCGKETAVWQSTFDSDEYGYEVKGIVNVYHCTNCGAEIQVLVPEEVDEDV